MAERIRDSENVALDLEAVDAGLAAMVSGADFADGVIAYEGRCLGGETFVSFDKKAVAAVEKQGQKAKLLE
jgi:predicted nucleic-acid-binding protein